MTDCALCGEPAVPGAELCIRCSVLPNTIGTATGTVVVNASGLAAENEPLPAAPAAKVEPGSRLGRRYELRRLLGKGGMGAVYLAHDTELGRDVALKVIAPHLASDPGVLERFKREIQLSSIVTHPNVLRVFDLGEAGGVKFLTMQYIEGDTLADVMRRERPMPVERAVSLFRQLCLGLAAAHEQGVLHRDLKPQNVMVDAEGRAYVTDFGLATSSELSAMTRAGALMGTPQYMSPEQVKGETVDARSDLFSLGVILHELLAGEAPFSGDTAFAVMMARMRPPPRAARAANPLVPGPLQAVVDRCLLVDPALRYASAAEIVADLDAGGPRRAPRRRARRARIAIAGTAAAAAAIALVVAVAVGLPRWRPRAPPNAGAPRTLLVSDFVNTTGDPIFDGTIEPALGLALEEASFITSYNRNAARKIADQLRLEGSALGDARARLVAQREGVQIVAAGAIERTADGYRVSVRADDVFSGRELLRHAEEVATKGEVLTGVAKLAARVRAALGDVTPQDVQVKLAEAFSAKSLEAAHAFSQALDLMRQAKHEEAKAQYLEALRLDPGLGRAYLGLAATERNLGHQAEAERYLKEAMARLDRMSEREKHRSRGYYYVFHRDADRAIEAYGELLKQFPVDASGHGNLAVAYQMKRDFARALAESREALRLNPRNHLTQHNVGLFESLSGDFDAAIPDLEKAIQQAPAYANAYVALAQAQAQAGRRGAAVETWEKLRALGPRDRAAGTEGLADLAASEGRLVDSRALLGEALASLATKEDAGLAARLTVALAETYETAGDAGAARSAARRALASSELEYVTFAAARVLASSGDPDRALAMADQLDRKLAPEPRMYAELLRGEVELARRNHAEAVARFKAAGQRVDAWLVHLALGRAYAAAGAYTEAGDELERCLKRRGEATDVYLDDVPTARVFPAVLYHLGRAAEGVGSGTAALEHYREFLATKRTDEDPAVLDARHRIARLEAAAGTAASR